MNEAKQKNRLLPSLSLDLPNSIPARLCAMSRAWLPNKCCC